MQSKVNAGKNVHLVDVYGALTASDLDDGVHPTPGGTDAQLWTAGEAPTSGGPTPPASS
ncbi:hypothetical protein [Promicromonospora sp. NPDC023805]|uniref:hypothetical protein n=1 Tax=Promicromonospora sp. NPDC023805 TaxID=3154696 RepID=UPI0033E6A192